MAYVISSACIDVTDQSCVSVCPVDCIYEGDRKLYVNPNECIDCGACEAVCPVTAIYLSTRLPEEERLHAEDNARFFAEPLPGRDEPLGDPGDSVAVGRIGVDTELVRRLAEGGAS
ncbi:MAG: 4Fe-4S binding protein [Actinomycetales bacterium]|nr:4Fe-4S binding protein [Actinomycetales bacterium]